MEKKFEEVETEKMMGRLEDTANLVMLWSLYQKCSFGKNEKENFKGFFKAELRG